jgi:serine/threonine-protein kinase
MRRGVFGVQSLIGQQLGDYMLEAELGRGSMGVVYRAQHVSQGKPYAVKVLLDALSSDMSFVTRFTREARIVSNLRHGNIIRVFEAGRQSQHLFFVMEYFPGLTAGQMLRERGRIAPGQTVEIVAQAADALDYAHREGHLVHRDIKPENLLVDRWYRVKVLDFGLARVEGLHSITRVGTVVGSLYYVSPEQLLGHKLDGRTDVYALGVSMYEMLTGQRPYRGQTLTDMSQAILTGVAVPPSQLEPSVPPELERIIMRALSRELDERYRSAGELHADLRALQASLAETHVHTAQPAATNPPVVATPPQPEQAPAPVTRAGQPTAAPRTLRGAIRPTALEPVSSPHPTPPPRQTLR